MLLSTIEYYSLGLSPCNIILFFSWCRQQQNKMKSQRKAGASDDDGRTDEEEQQQAEHKIKSVEIISCSSPLTSSPVPPTKSIGAHNWIRKRTTFIIRKCRPSPVYPIVISWRGWWWFVYKSGRRMMPDRWSLHHSNGNGTLTLDQKIAKQHASKYYISILIINNKNVRDCVANFWRTCAFCSRPSPL